MKRWILLILLLPLAACHAAAGPRLAWLETAFIPNEYDVRAKIFWFDRQWDVGDCSLGPGSHVTISLRGGTADYQTGLALSTTANGAQWRYGITMLAADGTTLAHLPSNHDARVYVANIPADAGIVTGTNGPIPPHVYDRVARVLIHARCYSRSRRERNRWSSSSRSREHHQRVARIPTSAGEVTQVRRPA